MLDEAARQARKISARGQEAFKALSEDPGGLLDQALTGKDRWNEAQVRFIHEARTAARRALYYVKLLEPDDEGEVFDHVQARALAQLQGPSVVEVARSLEERRDLDHEYSYSGARGAPYEWLVHFWRILIRAAEHAESHRRMKRLETGLETFIAWSEPYLLAIRWNYVRAPALLTWIRQHMGFLLGALAAGLVFVSVEAVWSLFRANVGVGVVAVVAALLPVLLLGTGQLLWRRWGRTPLWDMGGPAARAWKPVPYEPEEWIPRNRTVAGRVYSSLVLKAGLYVVLWLIVGAGLQGLTRLGFLEPVAVTIYLVSAILGAVALAGAVVDYADVHSQAPLRIWLLGGAAIYVFTLLAGTPMWFGITVLVVAFGILVWWAHRVRQSMVWRFAAVILVVAVGVEWLTHNRRHEDLWVEPESVDVQPYLQVNEWPFPVDSALPTPLVVMAASGGGSRAAIYTARTLEALEVDFAALARRLEVVSSVSGGSLANAGWIVERARGPGLGSTLSEDCSGPLSSRVASDFLRPTLLGVINDGRGRRIENTWASCPGLGEVSVDTLKARWRRALADGDSVPPFPIPLFNSVMLHRHAVVISPLDRSLYATPELTRDAREDNDYDRRAGGVIEPTWVVYRSGIYGLDDLLEYDPELTQAVRASANFPFGFPLVEVEATRPAHYSPYIWERVDGPGVVRLTDGGALSNSGMWSLFSLLMAQRDRLADRPVLLLIVDVSRMPRVGSRNRLKGLIETIQDKHPKGENLHHRMLEELRLSFGACFRSVQIDLPPRPEVNVYTTWALDGEAIDTLNHQFDREWTRAASEIEGWQESLPDCSHESAPPSRVPVS